MAKHSPERIAEIRRHLSALEERGVPVAEFAREIGVSAWMVYCWKRRFDAGAEVDGGVARGVRRDAAPRADLVEICGLPAVATIDVQVGEMLIRVPAGMPEESVRAVLRAVRSC